MARSVFSPCLLSIWLVAGAGAWPAIAQAPASGPPLSVEEVVKLWKTRVPEDLIITMIKKNGKAFNLSTEEVLELRNVGLSDNVVKFLLDPSHPYTPPAAPAVSQPPGAKPAPPKEYPADAHAAQVPSEPGQERRGAWPAWQAAPIAGAGAGRAGHPDTADPEPSRVDKAVPR